MESYFHVLFLFILNFSTEKTCVSGFVHLNYSYWIGADNGPENWAQLSPLSQCGGIRQSPIDIQTSDVIVENDLNDFQFYKEITDKRMDVLMNVGSTVGVEMNGLVRTISEGGLEGRYTFLQFHMHWANNDFSGSEHSIDGEFSPLEIHFVHWNADVYSELSEALEHEDGLAVLAVLVKVKDPDNKKQKLSVGFAQIAKFFEYVANTGDSYVIPNFSYASLFPEQKNYYRYPGSLTSPTCNQAVTWSVFRDPIYVSSKQIDALRKVNLAFQDFTTNARPTQPINDRSVFSCCDNFHLA